MREKTQQLRVPVSGQRNVLTFENADPNYVYRFVNDVGDRIEKFKAAGYEVVTHPGQVGDSKVDASKPVGSVVDKYVGLGVRAVLMRIRKDWYEEDQRAKQRNIDEIERSMRENAIAQNELKSGVLTIERS